VATKLVWSCLRKTLAGTAVLLLATGCGGDDPELSSAVSSTAEDVLQVGEALEPVATSGDSYRVDECENSGSGPVGPISGMKLELHPDSSREELLVAFAEAVDGLDYSEVRTEEGEDAAFERKRQGGWSSRLSIHEASDSAPEWAISGSIVPAVEC